MSGWELALAVVVPSLIVIGVVWKYICWQFEHRNISKSNQTLITNHLEHHTERIEPWMQEISDRTTRIETKVDMLIEKGE